MSHSRTADAPVRERVLRGLRSAEPAVVYLGAGVVVGGALLAVVAWALFAVSEGQPHGTGVYWAYREAAVVVAGLAAMSLLAGGVRLATAVGPVRRGIAAATLVGLVLCLVSVGLFVVAYPGEWNVTGTDYSLVGVSIYGLGLACLGASLGAAVHARYPGR